MALAVLVVGALGLVQDAAPVPALVSAVEAFVQLPEAERVAVVEQVERRLAESDNPGIRGWMALRAAALRELKVLPEVKTGFYPSLGRRYLEPGSATAQELAAQFARHGAEPLFIGQVCYDFASNTGVESEIFRDVVTDLALSPSNAAPFPGTYEIAELKVKLGMRYQGGKLQTTNYDEKGVAGPWLALAWQGGVAFELTQAKAKLRFVVEAGKAKAVEIEQGGKTFTAVRTAD